MSRSKKDLENEIKLLKRTGFLSNTSKVLISAFQYGTLAWIFYCINDSVNHLAGQETTAAITVDFMGSAFSALFGGGSLLYGRHQRKLRKDTVEQLQQRIRELEEKIDNDRSSSGLTERGDTNPEDI